MKALNDKVLAAITIANMTEYLKTQAESINSIMLKDVIATVAAIPADAMPKESNYHVLGGAMVAKFKEAITTDGHLAMKTFKNKWTMVKNATIAELHRTATLYNAQAAAQAAQDAAQAKPTKANTNRAASAAKRLEKAQAVESETSLDKASKAGVQAARRKTSKIVVAQPAKKTVAKKANPTKAEQAQAIATRKADRDLIQQALSHAREIHGMGDKATERQRLVALGGVAAVVDTIAKYLPKDMQTI